MVVNSAETSCRLVLLAESIKEPQRAPAKRNSKQQCEDRGNRAIGAFGSLNVIFGAKLFGLSRRHCTLGYFPPFVLQ